MSLFYDILYLRKLFKNFYRMRSFASDNNSGIHPSVMEALIKANQDHAVGYGDDEWTQEAVSMIREAFTPDCDPYFVFNGTGSNIVALQLITRPFNSIICTDMAHIYVDECGAPAKATGCQIIAIPTKDGKLTPELIKPFLGTIGDQHHSQPGAIYLSQCTELGTIYTPEELKAITSLAHENGIKVHMDGARLSNACAALHLSLKALTVDCGIDVVAFGGTKNGLMLGECVVVFDSEARKNAKFIRKQSAQLASKSRYLACQFTAYLKKRIVADQCPTCEYDGRQAARCAEPVSRHTLYAKDGKQSIVHEHASSAHRIFAAEILLLYME